MTLEEFFRDHPEVAIAFSGGVDSAYLLYAATRYAKRVHAYTVHSQFQPRFELDDARRLAAELGAALSVLRWMCSLFPARQKTGRIAAITASRPCSQRSAMPLSPTASRCSATAPTLLTQSPIARGCAPCASLPCVHRCANAASRRTPSARSAATPAFSPGTSLPTPVSPRARRLTNR